MADPLDEQVLLKLKSLGMIDNRRTDRFIEEQVPGAMNTFAVDLYKQQQQTKAGEQLQQPGLEYEQYKFGKSMSAPQLNVPKAIGTVAYARGGEPAVEQVGQAFSDKTPEDWIDKGKRLAGEYLSTPIEKVGKAIDWTRANTAHAYMAASDPNIDWAPGSAARMDPSTPGVDEEGVQKWRDTSKTTGAGILKGVSHELGRAIAIPVTGIGLAAQAINPDVDMNLKEAWEDAQGFGKNLATSIVTDPLPNLVSGGTYGGAKQVAKQGTKMALKSGMSKSVAKEIGEQLAKESFEQAGKFSAGKELKKLALSKGIKEEAFNKVVGEAGEFAGKKGFSIAGQQVGNFETGKAIGKARAFLGDKLDSTILKLNPAQREAYLQNIARVKTKLAGNVTQRIDDALKALPEEKIAEMRANPKALEEYARGFDKMSSGATSKGSLSMKIAINKELEAGNISKELADELKKDVSKRFSNKKLLNLDGKLVDAADTAHKETVKYLRQHTLFGRGGYFVQNVKSDVMLALMGKGASLRGAAAALTKNPNKQLFKDITGEAVSSSGLDKEMVDMGLASAVERSGSLFAPSPQDINRQVAAKVGGIGNKLRYADKTKLAGNIVSGGAAVLGEKVAGKWDHFAKKAVYSEFRMKGLSPREAAQATSDIIFNYADPGMFPGIQKAAKVLSPFIGWGYKAATRIPKAAMQSPGKVALLNKIKTHTGADSQNAEYDTPQYVKEKVSSTNLPDAGRRALNGILGAAGYGNIPEGMGVKMTARGPVSDVTSQVAGVGGIAVGDSSPQSSPLLSLYHAGVNKKDTFGQPTDLKTEGLKLVFGSNVATVAGEVATRTGTDNAFVYKDKEEAYPKLAQAARTMGHLTGERFVLSTPNTGLTNLEFSKDYQEGKSKLAKAKNEAMDEMVIKKLREAGMLPPR
jgi:hypothetical protein